MKKLNQMFIAVATALLTLTACSGGQSNTTTSSSTTPVTSPGTTPLTMAPSTTMPASTTMPQTLPSTTAVQTTTPTTGAPASTSGGSSLPDHDVARAFQESAHYMGNLDSYRITTTSKSIIAGMDMETTSVMDFFPKQNQYKIVNEIAGMKIESYMIKDKLYTKIPGGSWTVMTMDQPELNPEEALLRINDIKFFDLFSYEKTTDGYVLKTTRPLTMDEMKKLGSAAGNIGGAEEPDGLDEMGEDVEISYEMEIHLNKDHSNNNSNMKMNIKAGEMDIETVMQSVYSDYNKLKPFELPAEAEKATEIGVPTP